MNPTDAELASKLREQCNYEGRSKAHQMRDDTRQLLLEAAAALLSSPAAQEPVEGMVMVPRETLKHWAEYWNGHVSIQSILSEIDALLSASPRAVEGMVVPRATLQHWAEYWNGNRNDSAMSDALEHIINEIDNLLSRPAQEPGKGMEQQDFEPMLYEVAQSLADVLCGYLNAETPWKEAEAAVKAFHKWEDDNLPASPRAGEKEGK